MSPDLTVLAWVALGVAAGLVGFAKTSIGGVASLAVVLFATALPARVSTGALLPLLIAGDVVAVRWYRRHADWGVLVRLLPGVVPGLVVGAWFLSVVDDTAMRRTIGAVLLAMAALQLWQRRRPAAELVGGRPHPGLTLATGVLAGFATMTANAAGPVMTVYLVLAGMPMLGMLGTGAWFFAVVNLAKVPFSAGLDLLSWEALRTDLLLLPALLAGAVAGILVVRRIDQRQFELAALGLGAVAAALLLR